MLRVEVRDGNAKDCDRYAWQNLAWFAKQRKVSMKRALPGLAGDFLLMNGAMTVSEKESHKRFGIREKVCDQV